MKKLAFIALCGAVAFATEASQNPQNSQNQVAQSSQAIQASQVAPNPYNAPFYPASLPANINESIQKLYPGAFITDLDFEPYGYEVEINGGLELYFDRNGNLLGQKWDD